MNEYHSEALDTLREENCTREFLKLFEIDGEWYAFIHMEGDVKESNVTREINIQHKKIITEAIEEKIPLSDVYDLVL